MEPERERSGALQEGQKEEAIPSKLVGAAGGDEIPVGILRKGSNL